MVRLRGKRSVPLTLALLALGAVAGVAVLGVTTQATGRARLEALLAEHARLGHGASYRDLVLSAPRVDRERQDRAWAWMRRSSEALDLLVRSPHDVRWAFEEGDRPPAKLLEAHEAFRPEAEELTALLEGGGLCLTSLGWLDVDLAEADDVPLSRRAGMHIPNLLRVRAAARWLADEALLEADPEPALRALDLLHAALAEPGTLIDGMIRLALDGMRDECLLTLHLLGKLDVRRLEAWLDEPADEARLAARAWRAERLIFAAPLAQDLAAGRSFAAHFGGDASIDSAKDLWRWHVRPFFRAAHEAAVYLEGMVALERHLLGDLDVEATRRALTSLEDLGAPFDLMVPNADAVLASVVSGTAQHRAVRAAAALVQSAREAGRPPEDDEEARAWLGQRAALLEGDAHAPRLVVVTPAPDRFRVEVDAQGTLPALLGTTQLRQWASPAPAHGTWPAGQVFRRMGLQVEVRLPAPR